MIMEKKKYELIWYRRYEVIRAKLLKIIVRANTPASYLQPSKLSAIYKSVTKWTSQIVEVAGSGITPVPSVVDQI